MCGIAGYVARRGAVPDGLLQAMADSLAHRGPDGAGVWLRADRKLGLAHRRLAVLDLSPAAGQPMASVQGDAILSFNGEIYNHAELRVELVRRGCRFRTSSDTEVVLEAYRAWGSACLERLEGMFAFALYDAGARRLFLARDRAGEKPLFYRADARAFAFASELKALMVDPSFPRVIDPGALDRYLAYGYVPGGLCIFGAARKLPPGHALEYDVESGALTRWAYWSVPESPAPGATDLRALVEEAERWLEQAVARQLVADVPVGILLSGGLDSSLVTAMAARRAGPPVRTFTVTFPGDGSFNEAPYARLVAEHFGTRHTELPAQEVTPDLLPTLAQQCDEPIADCSLIPTYLVSRLMRAHVTVALGGDGGDELFAGYPHYSWVQRQARLRMVPAGVRAIAASIGERLPVGTRGRNHLIGVSGETGRGLAHVNVYFDAATRRRLLRRLDPRALAGPTPEAERAAAGAGGRSALQRMRRIDFRQYLADDLLVKVDRASMATSLEVRAPFLDRPMLEFAFARVPDGFLATPRERKVLLRALAARHLPAALDLRRKQGFTPPLARWVRGTWGDTLGGLLTSSEQPFDPAVIRTLLAGSTRRSLNAQRLYALAFFELWRQHYRAELPLS